MAESSNPTQIPSPPNVTTKEEPITLDRLESPNPFLPADQVEFKFDEMLFKTNLKNLPSLNICWQSVIQMCLMFLKLPNPLPMLRGFPKTSASTLVVAEMHKEDKQATGDPNSLGVTSEDGAHPQLISGNNASTDFTTEADLEISAPNDFRWVTTAHTVSSTKVDTRSAFINDEDQKDKPFIALVESSEEHAERNKDTHAEPKSTSVPPPSLSVQIQELQAQILLLKSHNQKLEQDKEKTAAEIANLKAQSVFRNINQLTEHLLYYHRTERTPTKIISLFGEVNELKKHIKEFEVEQLEVFNEILQKLETFSSTVPSLTTQVAELKKHKWELPKEFLDLPSQISSVQSHIKTLELLPGLLNKVTTTLTRFASILNAHTKGVPLAGKSTASPAKGKKNTNPVLEDAELANLVDLMGIDVVEGYHKKKLLYNKYCDKMLKRKKSPKITKCEFLTKKGPITLKIYKEDGSKEVISNLKVGDLHLAE
ncbi:hypothetical protein Tco_0512651 [Tanacetum coccineum]